MIPKTIMTILILLSMASVIMNEGKGIDACPSQARVVEIGEFHGDEVEAQTGEKWLGLHISNDGSMLLNYQLTVEAVYDPIVDEIIRRPERRSVLTFRSSLSFSSMPNRC